MANVLPYRPATSDIPTAPGVYRFLGDDDRVLYVGKAKNLRARLSNYFAPLERLHERTRHMVTTATRVEWTVVRTETEALQLEYTWIQEFSPPFNVKFKDDKSYPFMAVTLGDEPPALMSMADAARLSFPVVDLTEDQARDVGFGRALELAVPSDPTGLIAPSGELLALYRPTEAGSRPVAVLV